MPDDKPNALILQGDSRPQRTKPSTGDVMAKISSDALVIARNAAVIDCREGDSYPQSGDALPPLRLHDETSGDIHASPKDMTFQEFLSFCMPISDAYLQGGVVRFAEYAAKMIDALQMAGLQIEPAKFEPWIKGVYSGSKALISDDLFEKMDHDGVVRAFDFKSLSNKKSKGKIDDHRNIDRILRHLMQIIIGNNNFLHLEKNGSEAFVSADAYLNNAIGREVITIGEELAAFHLEAGAWKFANFAKIMTGELGASLVALSPYLCAWYNGGRNLLADHGMDVSTMDHPDAAKLELIRILSEETGRSNDKHQR